jgi:hypothetical protein
MNNPLNNNQHDGYDPSTKLEAKYMSSQSVDGIMRSQSTNKVPAAETKSQVQTPPKQLVSHMDEQKRDEKKSAPQNTDEPKEKIRFTFASIPATFTNAKRQLVRIWKRTLLGKGMLIAALFVGLLVMVTVFGSANGGNKPFQKQEVKGVTSGNEAKQVSDKQPEQKKPTEPTEYKKWITEKLGVYSDGLEDADGDQLTNNEEFIVGTEPKNAHSCDPNKTDSENLIELINPVSCKAIDMQNPAEVEKFRKVIDFQTVKTKIVNKDVNSVQPAPQNQSTTVSGLFGVASLEALNKQEINADKLKTDLENLKRKEDVIKKIDRINQYFKQYRSLEPFDRNYPIPVNGAVYMEVAQQYKVPLKYVIAVAQRESRFGTDRYTKEGDLTRPGKYQNIYSRGLDDEGNNIGFETWEKGVESFGKWYKKFHDRGVSDCAKWRIYNPNGDYCKAVEDTANEIEVYLNK